MKPTNQQVFNQGQELDRWACDLGINRPNEGEEVLYILKGKKYTVVVEGARPYRALGKATEIND